MSIAAANVGAAALPSSPATAGAANMNAALAALPRQATASESSLMIEDDNRNGQA